MANYGNLGKRPRHWAEDVAGGKVVLSSVPTEWRSTVETYLKIEELELQRHVRDILKCSTRDLRRARLAKCPLSMRKIVERRVRDIFEQRAENHGG